MHTKANSSLLQGDFSPGNVQRRAGGGRSAPHRAGATSRLPSALVVKEGFGTVILRVSEAQLKLGAWLSL